jgi:hypothetical protein
LSTNQQHTISLDFVFTARFQLEIRLTQKMHMVFRVAAEMALLSAARGCVHDRAQLYYGHLAGRANYQSVGTSLSFTVRNKRGGNKFAGKIWDPGIKVCGIIKCHVVIYPWTLQIIVQQPPLRGSRTPVNSLERFPFLGVAFPWASTISRRRNSSFFSPVTITSNAFLPSVSFSTRPRSSAWHTGHSAALLPWGQQQAAVRDGVGASQHPEGTGVGVWGFGNPGSSQYLGTVGFKTWSKTCSL